MNKYLQQIQSICNNKYIQTYVRICTYAYTRAQTKRTANSIVGYTEKHHILPKAFKLGGQKDTDNYVYLTAREHFICHKLLVCGMKQTSYYRLCLYAIGKFLQTNRNQKRIINSRDYEFVRKCVRESKVGSNNPMYGKIGNLSPRFGTLHSEETKAIIREKRKKQEITQSMLLALKNGRKDSTGTSPTLEVLEKLKKAQAGRVWVHNETHKHRIKKEQLQQYLDMGFLRGKGKSNKYKYAIERII